MDLGQGRVVRLAGVRSLTTGAAPSPARFRRIARTGHPRPALGLPCCPTSPPMVGKGLSRPRNPSDLRRRSVRSRLLIPPARGSSDTDCGRPIRASAPPCRQRARCATDCSAATNDGVYPPIASPSRVSGPGGGTMGCQGADRAAASRARADPVVCARAPAPRVCFSLRPRMLPGRVREISGQRRSPGSTSAGAGRDRIGLAPHASDADEAIRPETRFCKGSRWLIPAAADVGQSPAAARSSPGVCLRTERRSGGMRSGAPASVRSLTDTRKKLAGDTIPTVSSGAR